MTTANTTTENRNIIIDDIISLIHAAHPGHQLPLDQHLKGKVLSEVIGKDQFDGIIVRILESGCGTIQEVIKDLDASLHDFGILGREDWIDENNENNFGEILYLISNPQHTLSIVLVGESGAFVGIVYGTVHFTK